MFAMEPTRANALVCPVPLAGSSHILLAHGGGGSMMQRLLGDVFAPAFENAWLAAQHDGAVFEHKGSRFAFTTDSYVVRPLFFPGGDIGSLAVNGTVNDLAMCGARPLFLSAGFILEEGLPIETLRRIVESMRRAAETARVHIVTGDTKVVERGKGDGCYINTAGIGVVEHQRAIVPASVRPGDAILLSGDLGRHGMAILAAREEFAFETALESDCAPLADLVTPLLKPEIATHCLRDLTRGGLASALVEIARTEGLHLHFEEETIPVREDIRGACELLGLDPLYVANEGRCIAFVAPESARAALAALRHHPLGADATQIGEVHSGSPGLVTMSSAIGATRVLDLLSGEQLPRIC